MPLDGYFTYSVPDELVSQVRPYVRVKVPFGITKTHTALVVRVHDQKPSDDGIVVKPILLVLDASPVLLPQQWQQWQWMSTYYMCPLGDILTAALPQGMKKEGAYHARKETYVRIASEWQGEEYVRKALAVLQRSPKQLEVFIKYLELSGADVGAESKAVTREELTNATHVTSAIVKAVVDRGMLQLYDVEVGRLNTNGMPHPERIKQLNEAQQQAFEQLSADAVNGVGDGENLRNISLLHGVTSSGKTEIYIHLIQEAIDRGEQVMYLLPEIALTVQITQRLQHVFGNRLGIYHSKYSDAERVEIWQKQLSDTPYDVILGARSAVFLPYQRLGLVIIDEEHETSFKQQDPAPRYHARSVALMMAHWASARVVMGTATPSAESYYNAMQGKYHLVNLTQRYKNLQLPQIHVVDVRDLRRRKIMRGLLSPQLKEAIVGALANGEQAIVFHNRRGFSPIIECHQCGWSPKCPNCDVSLTYHKTTAVLSCHYCGYTYHMPSECPDCHNRDLRDRGAGTEKVEEMIIDEIGCSFGERAGGRNLLRVARMDLDTTRTRNAYERIIGEFGSGKTNLLIGTQMVTKGLDFDNVSVVGILSADTMLNQPDFRAFEHAFTMMTQVAGRAGRKGHRGQVFLQTNNPALPVVSQIVSNDYRGFFASLMRERKAFKYPPYTRLIYVFLKHREDGVVNSAAIELASRLRQSFDSRVLGPDKPAVARVKQLCIRKIMLKLEPTLSVARVRECIRFATNALMQDKRYKSLMVYYDVDPMC